MFEKANNIDEILSSLDGIKRAEAPPFLYTRILARLNSHRQGIFENLNNLISKPVIVISFLILFLDGIVLRSILKSMPEKSENTTGDTFAGESEITAEDFFATDDFEEMLFYEFPYSDYASNY